MFFTPGASVGWAFLVGARCCLRGCTLFSWLVRGRRLPSRRMDTPRWGGWVLRVLCHGLSYGQLLRRLPCLTIIVGSTLRVRRLHCRHLCHEIITTSCIEDLRLRSNTMSLRLRTAYRTLTSIRSIRTSINDFIRRSRGP